VRRIYAYKNIVTCAVFIFLTSSLAGKTALMPPSNLRLKKVTFPKYQSCGSLPQCIYAAACESQKSIIRTMIHVNRIFNYDIRNNYWLNFGIGGKKVDN
jgi:hypothetical protein